MGMVPIVLTPVEVICLQSYDEEVERIYREILESDLPDDVAIDILAELEKK